MKNMKRAVRRHHYFRLKVWAKRNLPWIDGQEEKLGMFAETPKSCSCYMCGNPRKHWNDDCKQEVLDKLKRKEDVAEWLASLP